MNFDPTTGAALKALRFHDVDQYATVERLRGLIELPPKLEAHCARIDELRDRLARPEAEPLPLPAVDDSIEDYQAHQASVTRAKADKAERSKLRAEYATRRGRGYAVGVPTMGKAVSVCRDALIPAVNDKLSALLSQSKITDADREAWDFLGRWYVMLTHIGLDEEQPDDIRPVQPPMIMADINGKTPVEFTSTRVRIRWDSPEMIFGNPEAATAGTVADAANGLPSLGDVKLLGEAGFRLLGFDDAVKLARYETAKELEPYAKSSRVKMPEGFAEFILAQVEAKGAKPFPSYLFN